MKRRENTNNITMVVEQMVKNGVLPLTRSKAWKPERLHAKIAAVLSEGDPSKYPAVLNSEGKRLYTDALVAQRAVRGQLKLIKNDFNEKWRKGTPGAAAFVTLRDEGMYFTVNPDDEGIAVMATARRREAEGATKAANHLTQNTELILSERRITDSLN